MAAVSWSRVTPRDASSRGSKVTTTSLSWPPNRSMWATPRMRSSWGRTSCSTQVRYEPTGPLDLLWSSTTASGGPVLRAVETTGCRAVRGYSGTWERRLSTRTMASSRSVPTRSSRVTLPLPDRASLVMRSRPCRLLSTSSCSSRISRSTSAGAAPGQFVDTLRVGISMSGVSWMGMPRSASTPKSTTRATPTTTPTGRRMARAMIPPPNPPSSGSLTGRTRRWSPPGRGAGARCPG